ncbi:MAG: acyloxyacyl hydrolase [Nitrospiraceae bacterium]
MRLLFILLLLEGLCLPIVPAVAEESVPAFQARDVVQKGAVEVGALVGYLQGINVLTSDSANRTALYVTPRVGLVLTDEIGQGWYAGNLAVLAEPLYARYTQPFPATAAGGGVVFKYNFLAFGRWMPYWNIGLGMLWTDLAPRIAEQSTPFNFVVHSGPGVSYFWTERLASTVEVDFHHISDAGMGERTRGLNAAMLSVGISILFPR